MLRSNPGAHRVQVTAAGYLPFEQELELRINALKLR